VVSAVESLSNVVLAKLDKGHTAADVEAVLEALEGVGIALHPTLVSFTPWTTLEDYLNTLEFFHARRAALHLPPIQLAIRLLVPPGSALLESQDAARWAQPLDRENFVHPWSHPDPRMDALHAQVAALVEDAEARREGAAVTWVRIRALAYAVAERPAPSEAMPPAEKPDPPRLTEHWFC
jgi:hypothetical protein